MPDTICCHERPAGCGAAGKARQRGRAERRHGPDSVRSSQAVSEAVLSAQVVRPPLQLVRLPVDRPQVAVAFLYARSGGVMDLIAHFWERLAFTPPLLRPDLHLVVATPMESDHVNINIPQLDPARFSGAMLYVPKAHRADVLALDAPTAAAFAAYISHQGARVLKNEPSSAAAALHSAEPPSAPVETAAAPAGGIDSLSTAATLPLTDLSAPLRHGMTADLSEVPLEPPTAKNSSNGKVPIDFLTGDADGIAWMTPLLLPLVHKRAPARQLVNVVMQLPPEVPCDTAPQVRLARDSDIPVLNRWRRLYKEERGILFDADMDAWVQHQRVYVYELPADAKPADSTDTPANGTPSAPPSGPIASVAKIDLDLQNLMEIGGVYTFPEYRNRGYGTAIVRDLAARIRQLGKKPTLQVDEQNEPALRLYDKAGWQRMGKLVRVWLTG
jgi:GNAT superfamily N-acetyltransferase